ncbi:MAG: DUF1697 domain-containing protein [Actinobacteria bacterium]|nr:DUF1697 domain-containing protein [Actinomycetota bacterium]
MKKSSLRTYVVLLRGINVGGHRKLPMADLRSLCAEAGHTSVATYIQSGNVVLRSSMDAPQVQADLEERLLVRLDSAVPVVVRTRSELEYLVENPPFDMRDLDPAKVVVMFSSTTLDSPLATIDAAGFAPERVAATAHELILDLPEGQGRSKLAAAVAKTAMGKAATGRNWRTVLKLLEMTKSVDLAD